jgi:hypothetical protein
MIGCDEKSHSIISVILLPKENDMSLIMMHEKNPKEGHSALILPQKIQGHEHQGKTGECSILKESKKYN